MKNLIPLTLLLTGTSLGAQSFEWNQKPAPAPAHPKEVQVVPPPTTDQEIQSGRAGVYPSTAEGQPTAYGETYASGELTSSHPELPLGTLLKVTNTENGRTVTVRVTDKGKECADCLVTLSEAAARFLGIEASAPVSLEQEGFSNWNPVAPAVADATPKSYERPSGIVAPPPAPRNEPAPEGASPTTFNRYPTIVRQDQPQQSVQPPAPTVGQEQAARGVLPEATATEYRPAQVARVAAEPTAAAPGERFSVQVAAYNNEAYALRRVSELKAQGLDDVYYQAITKEDGQVINRVYAGRYGNVTEAQAAARDISDRLQINGIVARM
jgi:rare lipoprotein A (peptidoglycan hydrolase)